jgi:hypothetical protein
MIPAPRIIFRSVVYALTAALVAAVHWRWPTPELYVAMLVLAYMAAHTLAARTLALWIDALYFALFDPEASRSARAHAKLERERRKAAQRAAKLARANEKAPPA